MSRDDGASPAGEIPYVLLSVFFDSRYSISIVHVKKRLKEHTDGADWVVIGPTNKVFKKFWCDTNCYVLILPLIILHPQIIPLLMERNLWQGT